MEPTNFELPLKEWDILPIEVYDKALNEVKEYFSDLSTEVVSTTEKSIKLLIGFVSFCSAAGLYILAKEPLTLFVFLVGMLSFYNMWKILSIIRGRTHYLNGLNVHSMLNHEFDNPEFTADDKIRLFYANCLERYVEKTSDLTSIVNSRNKLYNQYLALSLGLVMGISFYIGFIL